MQGAGPARTDGITLEFEKLHKGIGGLTIAKNKLRGEKSRNVFHIASQKSFKGKNKVKPVTTNLKKINIVEMMKKLTEECAYRCTKGTGKLLKRLFP